MGEAKNNESRLSSSLFKSSSSNVCSLISVLVSLSSDLKSILDTEWECRFGMKEEFVLVKVLLFLAMTMVLLDAVESTLETETSEAWEVEEKVDEMEFVVEEDAFREMSGELKSRELKLMFFFGMSGCLECITETADLSSWMWKFWLRSAAKVEVGESNSLVFDGFSELKRVPRFFVARGLMVVLLCSRVFFLCLIFGRKEGESGEEKNPSMFFSRFLNKFFGESISCACWASE